MKQFESVLDCFELSNGVKMPCVGFGTWDAQGEVVRRAVYNALQAGYRHFDTAPKYKNESAIGRAFSETRVRREDMFITSKVDVEDRGFDSTLAAFERSANALRTDYLDLYLIHWPCSPKSGESWIAENNDTWRALCRLYREGSVKAIGVSNFWVKHLTPLLGFEILPMVNQIEYHPGWPKDDVTVLCKKNGIQVSAWSPLGRGRVLDQPLLVDIADKYDKSPAQICLRWCLQNGVAPLPKSITPARIIANTELFDFELTSEEMHSIDTMPRTGWSGLDPDDFSA